MGKGVYILRTCNADMTSRNGFKWPKRGPVRCDDWDPEPKCGNGLHGLLRGKGDGTYLDWSPDAKWLVVLVDKSTVVDLGDKVKFPAGYVMHCGDQRSATAYMQSKYPGPAIVGATVSGGNWATVSGGDMATVSGGDWATVSGGDHAKVSGGNNAKVSGGDHAKVSGGNNAKVSGGDGAVLSAIWWDGSRYRLAVGYVGEDGIEPNVAYCVKDGKLVKADG